MIDEQLYPEIFDADYKPPQIPMARKSKRRPFKTLQMLDSGLWVARYSQRMTQTELARRTNVSRKTINEIESGKSIPNVLIALRIAEVLN